MGWRYRITFYYGQDYKRSKKGELSIQTVHSDEVSRDIEIKAGKSRPEIGLITQLDLQTGEYKVIQHSHGR